MTIGGRLALLRKERSLSKRDLVSALPLNYSTYANYESDFREPCAEIIQMLARHFDVSVDFLMGATDNRKRADDIAILSDAEHEHITSYRTLDAHGRELVDCVLGIECARLKQPSEKTTGDKQWVSLPMYPQSACALLGDYLGGGQAARDIRFMPTPVSLRADFCVRVQGDAMAPKICDGDIVFVKSAHRVEPDSIGLFAYDGEVFCSRLRIDKKNNALYLEPGNKAHRPTHIAWPDKLRTVGSVIGLADRSKEN